MHKFVINVYIYMYIPTPSTCVVLNTTLLIVRGGEFYFVRVNVIWLDINIVCDHK